MSVMAPTPRRLRFGVVNEVVHETAGGWLGHVRRVEESGADTILIRDHLAAGPFGPQLAPLAAAAAAAAHTSRLRVGTMVLSNDYRHPALVAHEAATIDRISEGRFELGLGAGWLAGEYQQMGIPFEPARTRIARLEEAVQIITALLAGQTVTVHGAELHQKILGGLVEDGLADDVLAARRGDELAVEQRLQHASALHAADLHNLRRGHRLLIGNYGQRLQRRQRQIVRASC